MRHHSPACARLVETVLRSNRPACVLIEGPSDFNGRLDEMLLGHTLPIALFSFQRGQGGSWTPFCDYSPEWVALRVGRELGAEVRFMDLPAWHRALRERTNRYSDRRTDPERELARELGFDDPDSLWDHLFEHPGEGLEERLRAYFTAIRDQIEPGDAEREEFMARCLGWARAHHGERVVVVCGGYHAPALTPVGDDWPELPAEPETGSYLVPFSFHRLDSFQGYAAGMPSPGYYQHVWEGGPKRAASLALRDAVARLRTRRLAVSSADLVAASTLTHGLARLRGHEVPLRTDLLDGLAGALIKQELSCELPWSRRGWLPANTDPILVELVAAFSGARRGQLAEGTPHPPLVADVRARLVELELVPTRPARQVTVEVGTQRSQCLHQLGLLGLPGFTRLREGLLEEDWALHEVLELDSALVEASVHGSDLPGAALSVLEEALLRAEDSAALAAILVAGVRAGLELPARERVARAIGAEIDLARLGAALDLLFKLYRQDLGDLGLILAAGFARGLWLFEGLDGSAPGCLRAVVVLRDMHRLGQSLDLARELAEGVMRRRLASAPLDGQGAALGYLWSLGLGEGAPEAAAAVRAVSPPEALGDFLAGLFLLAREEVQRAEDLLGLLDERVRGLHPREFLRALPGLRLAFSAFPPRERQAVAAVIARLHGLESPFELTHAPVAPELVAEGMKLELEVEEIVQRYGLY